MTGVNSGSEDGDDFVRPLSEDLLIPEPDRPLLQYTKVLRPCRAATTASMDEHALRSG